MSLPICAQSIPLPTSPPSLWDQCVPRKTQSRIKPRVPQSNHGDNCILKCTVLFIACTIFLALSTSLSSSLSLFLSHSLSTSLSPSLSLSLFLSPSSSHSHSLTHSPSLSFSLSFSPSFSLPLSLPLTLSLTLPLSFFLSLNSLSLSLSLSLSHSHAFPRSKQRLNTISHSPAASSVHKRSSNPRCIIYSLIVSSITACSLSLTLPISLFFSLPLSVSSEYSPHIQCIPCPCSCLSLSLSLSLSIFPSLCHSIYHTGSPSFLPPPPHPLVLSCLSLINERGMKVTNDLYRKCHTAFQCLH